LSSFCLSRLVYVCLCFPSLIDCIVDICFSLYHLVVISCVFPRSSLLSLLRLCSAFPLPGSLLYFFYHISLLLVSYPICDWIRSCLWLLVFAWHYSWFVIRWFVVVFDSPSRIHYRST
jgi:hypothetical protein